MPCTYYTEAEERQLSRDALDKLARMLCSTLKYIESHDGMDETVMVSDLDQETQEWWTNHKQHDAEREAKEAEKKESDVVNKLISEVLKNPTVQNLMKDEQIRNSVQGLLKLLRK